MRTRTGSEEYCVADVLLVSHLQLALPPVLMSAAAAVADDGSDQESDPRLTPPYWLLMNLRMQLHLHS